MGKCIETSIEICECGHERRDHFKGCGKCIMCDANLGMLCSHFKHPVTDYGKFWAAFLETYHQMKNPIVHWMPPRIFVSIIKIRSAICKKLKLTRKEFDELLRKAVEIDNVRLHGAPTSEYTKVKNPFEYNGQLWLYLSYHPFVGCT
ncbi:MAG: hypothetical protein PHW62_00415 [Candidatus Ratteibacteria bacterium]|nr:hypothetical protein [Candidatus Ratteibacteria bacterium]